MLIRRCLQRGKKYSLHSRNNNSKKWKMVIFESFIFMKITRHRRQQSNRRHVICHGWRNHTASLHPPHRLQSTYPHTSLLSIYLNGNDAHRVVEAKYFAWNIQLAALTANTYSVHVCCFSPIVDSFWWWYILTVFIVVADIAHDLDKCAVFFPIVFALPNTHCWSTVILLSYFFCNRLIW